MRPKNRSFPRPNPRVSTKARTWTPSNDAVHRSLRIGPLCALGNDQAAEQPAAELHADLAEDVSTEEGTDDADDDVAEEAEAIASHELSGEPACDRADDDEPK